MGSLAIAPGIVNRSVARRLFVLLMRLAIINQFYTPDLSPTAHLCDRWPSIGRHWAIKSPSLPVAADISASFRCLSPSPDFDGLSRVVFRGRVGVGVKT